MIEENADEDDEVLYSVFIEKKKHFQGDNDLQEDDQIEIIDEEDLIRECINENYKEIFE